MDRAEALKNEGNARKAAGDLAGAAECYRAALGADADYVPALYNLGLVRREQERFEEAEKCFRRVLALDPAEVDALFHLADLAGRNGRLEEAEELYARGLDTAPENAYLWLHRGEVLRRLGRPDEALRCALRVEDLAPAIAEAQSLIGALLRERGEPGAALERYRKAATLAPDDATLLRDIAGILIETGAYEEAIEQLRRAIELRPDLVEAHLNLGVAQALRGRQDIAVSCFEEAHRLAPDRADVIAMLLFEMQQLCQWSRLAELSRSLIAGLYAPGAGDRRIEPFRMLSVPATRADQLQAARLVSDAELLAVRDQGGQEDRRHAVREHRRLRVGYLSADLRVHPVAHLAAELFEVHDRSRFEFSAYSYGADDGSPMRRRLERAFERFVDVRALPHAEAAARIRRDEIDILVDLTGHTQDARLRILALRPAPIQVNWLGYPGTMGASFIDYLISDAFITPPEHEADYAEKLVLMPSTYQPNDRNRPIGATPARHALGLPPRGFVFCCFNQLYKILPQMFDAWMRILAAVPESVLWALEFNPRSLENLRREAAARGVDPARLVAAPLLALPEHLGRLRAADLFVDTLPYNAHTSASDALWAGLPVLTCPGETFASRVAGSLVRAAGMPELVAGSLAEYEKTAIRLARDPGELAALREKLAHNRERCALFDTPRFARDLERAYQLMWQNYRAGHPPRKIELSLNR